jgi:sRNA-binding carbon storage regulator CsrA
LVLSVTTPSGDVRIDVSLESLRGRTAKLGFEAPDCVKILRGELFDEEIALQANG